MNTVIGDILEDYNHYKLGTLWKTLEDMPSLEEYYMLVAYDDNMVGLMNLEGGCYKHRAIQVKNYKHITRHEWGQIIGGTAYFERYTRVGRVHITNNN